MYVPTPEGVWQGRDDRAESDAALRVFQTIKRWPTWQPDTAADHLVMLGFCCDEGVRRNLGRVGASHAPAALRQQLGNLAHHPSVWPLVDAGDVVCANTDLETAQQVLSEAVSAVHTHGGRTLIMGGGHETAWTHARGIWSAWPYQHIALVNFDPHLDMRHAVEATSGTSFAQLAQWAQQQGRRFDYTCVGVNRSANTAALLNAAQNEGVNMIWDTDVHWHNVATIAAQLHALVCRVDGLYVTVDLDVLNAAEMPAVSAPAALGMSLSVLLYLLRPLMQSGKVLGADVVELNPQYDIDNHGARVGARVLWQMWQDWR